MINVHFECKGGALLCCFGTLRGLQMPYLSFDNMTLYCTDVCETNSIKSKITQVMLGITSDFLDTIYVYMLYHP